MKPITAQEARAIASNETKEYSYLLSEFFHDVDYFMTIKKMEMKFQRNNGGYGVKTFTDEEIEYIKSLGYNINWDGDCLWYEVNW